MSGKVKRDVVLPVKLRPDEKVDVDREAAHHGLTPTQWARAQLLRLARRKRPPPALAAND